jgi:2-dehydro-3-deoxyphosphogalactonate aldolase
MTDVARPSPFRLPLIAILRGITPGDVIAHAKVLVDEGFDAIEVPLNSPDWRTSIALLVARHLPATWIGGGTVLHVDDVDVLADGGARFIVTPHTDAGVIAHAVARGLQVVAGFASATEAFAALAAGAQMLKLFPAASYGPGHLRALRAVLPPVPLFVVGGVDATTLPDWLRAGADGAGIGGELYRPGQSVQTTLANARALRQAMVEFRR